MKLLHYTVLILMTLIITQEVKAIDKIHDKFNASTANKIDAKTLANDLQSYLIIDVRSQLEYEVIHIQGAYNISMSNLGFELRVQQLCQRECRIVTYCNGKDCKKSKLAANRLVKAGFKSVHYFPAGVLDWVKIYPNKTVLLKQLPANLNNLVSKQDMAEHTLDPKAFFLKVETEGTVFVDVRDNFQSRLDKDNNQYKRLNSARRIPLGRFKQAIENGFGKDSTLLIVDAVGRQVVWLQYYLKLFGYKNYYFLKGGAKSTNDSK